MRVNIKNKYGKIYRISRTKPGSAYRYKKYGEPHFFKNNEWGDPEVEKWFHPDHWTKIIVNYNTGLVFSFHYEYDTPATVEIKDINNKVIKDGAGARIHAEYDEYRNVISTYKFYRDEYGNPDPTELIYLETYDLNGNHVANNAVNPPL